MKPQTVDEIYNPELTVKAEQILERAIKRANAMIDPEYVEKELPLNEQQIISIINEANRGDVYEGMPEEDKREEVARELISHAVDFWQNDNGHGDIVRTIISIAGIYIDDDNELHTTPPEKPHFNPTPKQQKKIEEIVKNRKPLPASPPPIDDDDDQPGGGESGLSTLEATGSLISISDNPFALKERAIAKARKEGLPEPPEPDLDSDPVLPRDLSVISGDQLNQLYLDFTACLVRATYLLSLEIIDARSFERIAERAEREAFTQLEKNDDKGKRKLKDDLLAEAASDPEVIKWRDLESEAEANVTVFKAMRDGYQAAVDALSRVGGFRQEEAKRSGILPVRER